MVVHTPVHASWLNQVEIYFSIIQRKVLTPNDFANLEAVRLRLALYEDLSNQSPTPFQWKFDRTPTDNPVGKNRGSSTTTRSCPASLLGGGCITWVLFMKRST